METGAWWQDQFGLLQVYSPSSGNLIFVAHVKSYYINAGYTMHTRHLKIVIVLDIVLFEDK